MPVPKPRRPRRLKGMPGVRLPLPRTLCVLAACLLFVPASSAAPRRYAGGFREGFELNANLTYFHIASKAQINDDLGFGFRFGYLYNPNHEIEFLFNGV